LGKNSYYKSSILGDILTKLGAFFTKRLVTLGFRQSIKEEEEEATWAHLTLDDL
jgi:hypothetical protein